MLAGYVATNRILNYFLNYINSVHKNISLTMEIEENGSINVLDLMI